MAYDVTYWEGEGLIVIRSREPFSWMLALKMAREALALARKNGVKRILYDVRQSPNGESIVGNYRIAYGNLLSLGVPRGIRAAILAAPDDHSYDMVATLCLNAGVDVMLFREEHRAMTWLQERLPMDAGSPGPPRVNP